MNRFVRAPTADIGSVGDLALRVDHNLRDLEGVLHGPTCVQNANAAANINSAQDLVLVDATTAPTTVTLPPWSECWKPITVQKTDATGNAVTAAASGTDTISGPAVIAAQWGSLKLIPIPGGWASV